MDKNLEKLSDFDYELLWMSSRYAIGRHTIAACMLPSRIAREMYGRMSDEQLKAQCADIRRNIYDELHVWYNFEIVDYSLVESMDPIALFIECLETQNIVDFKRSVEVFGYNTNNEVFFKKKTDDKSSDYSAPIHYITDLTDWASLANLFNKENWLKVTVKTKDGKEEVIPAYSAWVDDFREEIPVRRVYRSLNEISSTLYINPDLIVKIEPYDKEQ